LTLIVIALAAAHTNCWCLTSSQRFLITIIKRALTRRRRRRHRGAGGGGKADVFICALQWQSSNVKVSSKCSSSTLVVVLVQFSSSC